MDPEISDCARLAKSTGADYIQFKTYSGAPFEANLHASVLAEIDRALDHACATFDVHVAERIFENSSVQTRGYARCHFQAMKTIVNADGSVYPCAQMRTNPATCIGNIHEASVEEIWNGARRRGLVERLDPQRCPYCVHDRQNQLIEFLGHFKAPHRAFY